MTADVATADTTGDPAADPAGGLRRRVAIDATRGLALLGIMAATRYPRPPRRGLHLEFRGVRGAGRCQFAVLAGVGIANDRAGGCPPARPHRPRRCSAPRRSDRGDRARVRLHRRQVRRGGDTLTFTSRTSCSSTPPTTYAPMPGYLLQVAAVLLLGVLWRATAGRGPPESLVSAVAGAARRLAARERAPADRPDEATPWPSWPVQQPVAGDG